MFSFGYRNKSIKTSFWRLDEVEEFTEKSELCVSVLNLEAGIYGESWECGSIIWDLRRELGKCPVIWV